MEQLKTGTDSLFILLGAIMVLAKPECIASTMIAPSKMNSESVPVLSCSISPP